MYKRIISLLVVQLCFFTVVLAQVYAVRGRVVEAPDRQAVEFATVALLRPDSSLVVGGHTDGQGNFQLSLKSPGPYYLKLSFVGFKTLYRKMEVEASHPVTDVGILELSHDEQWLGTATVTATLSKVEQVEDTTMFNAAAYRVPEGSTLEALVKQLPGVEVTDDGTITWNGKQIKEFLVNGKDFFKGQMDIALQNLPSDWISKIKAYDKQSEYTEQTGIDDGEEYPVLDVVTKKELDQTVIANTDLAYGTKDRYFGKLFLSRFTDHSRVSTYGSMNNVNDKSFGGKRKRDKGGLVDRKNAGIDFVWNNGKKKREARRLELGGNVNYNHSHSNLLSRTETENFLASGSSSSFRSSWAQSGLSSTNFTTCFNLEWNPDTMTNIRFRPAFSHNESHNNGQSRTASFKADPFDIDGILSPLDSIWADHPNKELEDITVNRNTRLNKGNRKESHVDGILSIVRKLNTKGRNVSLNVTGAYVRNDNSSFSISNIYYYNGKPNRYLNQFSDMPSVKWQYRVQLGYVEPLGKKWFGELRYAYSSKYTDSDRSRYNLDDIDSLYGTWFNPLDYPSIGTLPEEEILAAVRDSVNSQYATYRYYDHNTNVNLRYQTKAIRFTAGINFNPEKTQMAYQRVGQGIDTSIVRKVFKISPQMNFRYRMDKRNSVEARYRGRSSQPSMTDLLAVVDNSHPLNVTMGNPALDPSWTHSLDLGYRGYQVERQQGMSVGYNFTHTSKAVSHLSVYDESTGIRYHRPQNIDGNWNMRLNYVFNTGLGKEKNFTLATHTHFLYNHAVGYISSFSSGASFPSDGSFSDYSCYDEIFENALIQKNTTRTTGIRERLNLAYRKEGWEVGIFGAMNYNHSRSDLRERNDRDTWNYDYGLNTHLKWNMGISVSSDIRVSSRRGYPNATMNTDEWLWNAQVTYSFLKKKAATISLQWYDILQQQSNVSHFLSATRRSDSWNNDIHTYGMIHFIYKFRYIGGKHKKGNSKKTWKKKRQSILDDESLLSD